MTDETWQARPRTSLSENHTEMSHPGQKVKTMHRPEPPPQLFSLIQSHSRALCNWDGEALSVSFLMAGDSYCLFPETRINGFVKSTFTTAHISHPLGICLEVQAGSMYFKMSALKQTEGNRLLSPGNQRRCCLRAQEGREKQTQNRSPRHWPFSSVTVTSEKGPVHPRQWERLGLRRLWFQFSSFPIALCLSCPICNT